MKNLLFTLGILLVSQTSLAKPQKACFIVEGMTCATCAITTKVAVKKLEGIKDIDVSVKDKSAIINFEDDQTTIGRIKEKIDSTGYQATQKQCEEG